MFEAEEIKYESLLERLGGRESLELMINARDFSAIYHNKQGLSFTFRVHDNDRLRIAKFIPCPLSRAHDSYSRPQYMYQIRMTIETLKGISFELAKPHHHVILEHPTRMKGTFETAAQVAITF
jgi:hypothetical protein